VREVVGRRLDHLSEQCNRVLTIASAIGREFGLDALERVVGAQHDAPVTGDRLLEVLEEAVGARVVAEVPRVVGRYSFTHALIWETLYEELSTARRVRLHRQIGEVLEELHGANLDPHLAALAYHFFEAAPGGDVDKAIDYARRAGDRAAALLAHEDAVQQYGLALQAQELRDKPDDRLRCELLLALGEAQRKAGEPEKSTDTLKQAFALAERLGDADLMGGVALAYAAASFDGPLQFTGAAVPLLRRALEALGEEDRPLRGMLLCALSIDLNIMYPRIQRNLEERQALALEAKALGERIRDPGVQAHALWRLSWCRIGPELARERLVAAKETISLAQEAGDVPAVLWGHWQTVADSLLLGDMETVDREIESTLEMAEQTREPVYLGWPPVWRAMRACMQGQYEEAERRAQQLLVIGQRLQNPFYVQSSLVQMFDIRLNQGRMGELEGAVKGTVQENPDNVPWLAGLAYLYAELERELEAREHFGKLASEDFADIPEDVSYLITLALAAMVAHFLHDARRAEILYGMLKPYDGLNITVNNGALCIGAASRILGVLASTMSRWDEAEAHFLDGIAGNEKIGDRPWLARGRFEYARMLLARDAVGGREKALEQLDHALPIFQELGMKLFLERALALKLRAQGIDPTETRTSIYAVASAVYVEKPDLRTHAAPDGTVTILFTDIEGSTALAQRLGDQPYHALLAEHNRILREQVTTHGGHEVKSTGDGFMVAFASAARALSCAVDIQKAFAAHNQEHTGSPIAVRIGLNTGESIQEEGDYFGTAVTLAARIADRAKGGQILVSEVVRTVGGSLAGVEFRDAGRKQLKGIKGRQRLFEVEWG
jgi:class 3 adenylate cyclase